MYVLFSLTTFYSQHVLCKQREIIIERVCGCPLQYQSAFQSSNLIGWVWVYKGWDRVNLRCCYGNGAYVHMVVYNIWLQL